MIMYISVNISTKEMLKKKTTTRKKMRLIKIGGSRASRLISSQK